MKPNDTITALPFTKQQLSDWERFEKVRQSGRWNMFFPQARAGKGREVMNLCRAILGTTCPHCDKVRSRMRCWRFAALFFAVLLIVLLTIHK